jgi:hypothetical protein
MTVQAAGDLVDDAGGDHERFENIAWDRTELYPTVRAHMVGRPGLLDIEARRLASAHVNDPNRLAEDLPRPGNGSHTS